MIQCDVDQINLFIGDLKTGKSSSSLTDKNREFMEEILREFDKSSIGSGKTDDENEESNVSDDKNRCRDNYKTSSISLYAQY